MQRFVIGITAIWMVFVALSFSGCKAQKPYVPVEPTAEQLELKKKLAPLRDKFAKAFASSGDYVLVDVLDRERKFPDMLEGTFTQLLILHREQLDLDDYNFSKPGKETAEDDQLETVLGEYFWINKDGEIVFDDMNQPPGTEMVVEWFVKSGSPDVSLHFGGNPCLKIRLNDQ